MTRCDESRHLIERLLDGTIGEAEREQLKSHAESCQTCRGELDRCHLVEEVVKDAFAAPTGAGGCMRPCC